MGDLSPHFSTSEFLCPCCGAGKGKISPALIEALETIREFAGIPIQITSGYRCQKHNADVGGKPDSAHLLGEAADFWVSGDRDRFLFLEAIFLHGPVRIGISFKGQFLHVDVSETLPGEVCWGYAE